MRQVTYIRTMLVRLDFSDAAAQYMVDTLGIDSLDEISIYDEDDDVGNLMKRITRPGGAGTKTTSGMGDKIVTTVTVGHPVYLRA